MDELSTDEVVGRKLQATRQLGLWLMVGVCSLSVLRSYKRHCMYLFSCMVIWKEKESSRIRDVQLDNPRGLLCISSMDKVLNAWIRELCEVMKWVDERIDCVLRWFRHMERMEKDMIIKRVYVEVCAGS